jgi:serine/threonine protein kinase
MGMTERIGQQLGNYRLIRHLGKGGFAEVYLGEHIYLKTQAAIKLLQTKVANQEDLDSFLKEAQTIAHLVHPHIVRVLDFGVDGETPFLAMDYAPNGTLRQLHPRGTKLPVTTVIPYVKQIADALQHAHDEKLIHRDIKPENMLVGRRNDILLSDFGIALIAQSSRYQSTQDVIGTVAYMSPEQIQGKPRPASDQYSLGIVVYEWLSGERPFNGSFTELCTQHMFAPLPPLRERVPTLPPDVEQVVTIALAKDPKQRFGSIQAFATALEQANEPFVAPPRSVALPLESHPLLTPPVPPPTQTPAIPLSLAPNQVATPLQPTSLSSSTNLPANAQPIIARTTSKEKVNVWKIGKREVVATLIGMALYVGLSHLFVLFDFSAGFIVIIPALLIPLLLGMRFGPWTGLAIGGIGFFIGEFIGPPSHWSFSLGSVQIGYIPAGDLLLWDLSTALSGFVAGLTMLITKGRYNIRNIVIADTIIAISVFLGVGFALLISVGLYFIEIALPTSVFISIFLPISLITYNAIADRRRRA